MPPTVTSRGAANLRNFSLVILFFTSRRTLCWPGNSLMTFALEDEEELLLPNGSLSPESSDSPLALDPLPLEAPFPLPPPLRTTIPPGRSSPSSPSVAEPAAPNSPSLSSPSFSSSSTSSHPAFVVSISATGGSTDVIFAFTMRRLTFTRTTSPTLKTAPELTLTSGIFPVVMFSPKPAKFDVPAAEDGIVVVPEVKEDRFNRRDAGENETAGLQAVEGSRVLRRSQSFKIVEAEGQKWRNELRRSDVATKTRERQLEKFVVVTSQNFCESRRYRA
mmetsp:Transcript_26137/g.65854  ORF Transcript_26137/g.65854 Transcript_26137/m.65854 type:complete len:276 (-) Transcript_26137:215-1042(-)